MRTIVAFLLTSIAAAAQSSAEIDRLEKRVAENPDNATNHQALLGALSTSNALPVERIRQERREQMLWLIRHAPDSKVFENPFDQLWPRGRLGDPDGFAQAAQLWKDLASKPDASPMTIANAALFFRAGDQVQGLAILDAAKTTYAGDPNLARVRGMLDTSLMVGVSGIDDSNSIRFTTSGAARTGRAAINAREEVGASNDAHLIGGAGDFLSRPGALAIPFDLTFGDDDVPSLAEKWLRRARALAPSESEWNTPLGNAIRQRAQRTNDPAEKLRLLQEALTLMPDNAKPGVRSEIVNAEFAAGDDASAERDAKAMADAPQNANEYNLGQTILGRLAAARGDISEAEQRLLASLKPPAKFKNPVFEPNMTLAQDIYGAGDKDAVLQFLEASRVVWKFDRGRIDRMISFVKKAPSVDLVQLSRQFPGAEVLRRPAPAFEAKDLEGATWTREQLAGKVVALEFGSAPLAEKVAKDFAGRGAVLLKIQDDATRRRFEVLTSPTLVVIDRQGNVTGFRSGEATEADLRTEIESGFRRGSNPLSLPAPKQLDGKIAWEPVNNAESYVVEWDSREENGWVFDKEHTVRVIPTRETSVLLDLKGFNKIRWRVYAVPRSGQPGSPSAWVEVDGLPLTKIYK